MKCAAPAVRPGGMRRKTIELAVGLGLLLGPLAYALTLEPEVVEVTRVVEIEHVSPQVIAPVDVVPVVEAPVVEPPPIAAAPEPAPEDALSFALVTEAGLVLSSGAQATWGTGRLHAHAGPGEYRAAKRADARKVPEDLWAQRGRTFDLYDADGDRVCTARLGDLSVLAQHNGPGLWDVFYDEYGDAPDVDYEEFEEEKHTPRQIRRAVWSRVDAESMWLVAEVVSEDSCEGALWARDAQLPAPSVLHRSEEPNEAATRRLTEFETSEELAQTRTDYRQWYAELSDEEKEYETEWSAIAEQFPAKALTWLDAEGEPRLVELSFGVASEGCGEGYDTVIQSLAVVAGDSFEETETGTHPIAVFDADLDGQWEFIFNDGIYGQPSLLHGETLATSWDIDETFYCPC